MYKRTRDDDHPSPSIPPFDVSPHLLLRLNPTPTRSLGSSGVASDAADLTELTELETAQRQVAEKLTDLLYDVAGSCDRDTRQQIVLPLRRAIHNGRLPRRLAREDVRAVASDPVIEAWLDRQERIEALNARLLDAHDARLTEERAALREILGGDWIRRSLAMSSELLPTAADKYRAAPWEQVRKNTRKSEEPLLRYAMRACTKTSPFSLYTVAGFLPDTHDGAAEGIGEITSTMEAHRGFLRRVEARLSRLPVTRDAMRFHASAGLRLEDGRFIATGNREQLGSEAADIAARYGEAKVTVPANPAAVALLNWLRTRERGGARFAELVALIAERVPGADAAKATAFVSRLCDIGVLTPEPIVDDATPDALRVLCERLADFAHDHTVAEVRAELIRLCDAQDRFPQADPTERTRLLRFGRERRDAVLALLGDDVADNPAPEPIWYEDGTVTPACGTTADWAPVLEDCRRLLDILQIFDEQHVFSRVLVHRFTSRFGSGGVCDDLDVLGEMFVPAYDDALQITEGFDHELARQDPVLSRLVPLRAEIVSGLAERLLASGDEPGPPVEIDPDLARLVAERAPSWVSESPASYGVFMQPLGGNPPTGAIFNKIYNGWGNYVSRFLTHASDDVVAGVRAMVRDNHPAGVTAELRPVQGFNANIHPLLAEVDLDWDNDGDPDRLPLDRLTMRHDAAADRVTLWDPRTGRRVHPLYLGFLIPYYLSSRLLPLTAMGGSGSIFFEPQVSADRSPTVDRSTVRHYRGLRFGSIWLARPRWHVPSGLIPRPEPGETDPDYFLRLSRWRTGHGIPDHVFVHPPAPELNPGNVDDYFGSYMDNRKPQYVNLLSRLHVRYLDRLLAYQPGVDIVVEEAKPGPDEHFPIGGESHAVELVAEFYRKANA